MADLLTRRSEILCERVLWRGPTLEVSEWGSLQECIIVYATLLDRMKELDELRERLEEAKKLCAAMPETNEAEARQLSPAGSHT
jgi:hypothetical protein